MKSIFSIVALAVSLMLTSLACQRSESPQNGEPAQPLYLGNLDQKTSEIYSEQNKNFLSVCDYQWKSKILEISRVLEEKREAIEAMSRDGANSGTAKVIDFGPFKFIDDSQQPAGKDAWSEKISSWSRIAKIYDWIKDDPKDPRWLTLNRMARGIVVDDEKRIALGVFYSLSRQAEPMVLEIERKAVACQKNANCVNPSLNEAEINYLTTHPYYTNAIRTFRSNKATFEQKRENIERFTKRLQLLAERYVFYKEDLLKIDGKVIRVPLNLTALGDEGAALFIEFAEKTWNIDPDYSVKIELVKDSSPAYVVQVGEEIGKRANVNRKSRVMNLFNWGTVNTLNHEFGHILGFQDRYFTSWSVDTCSYTMESNGSDLMSSSADGAVLARHWSKLKEVYWSATQPSMLGF